MGLSTSTDTRSALGHSRMPIVLSPQPSTFVIQVSSAPTFTGAVGNFTRPANTSSWLHTNLPRGTTIYYRIRAENATGVSGWVNMTPFPIVTP